MSRYIDAEIALNNLDSNKYGVELNQEELKDRFEDVYNYIENQPTAEVVPVIHARWEYDMDGIYKCLNCFAETKVPDRMNRPIYEYCPYCGAKMDESVKQ